MKNKFIAVGNFRRSYPHTKL